MLNDSAPDSKLSVTGSSPTGELQFLISTIYTKKLNTRTSIVHEIQNKNYKINKSTNECIPTRVCGTNESIVE